MTAQETYRAALYAREAAFVAFAAAERQAAIVCEDSAEAALRYDHLRTPETEAAANAADEAAFHATVALRQAETALAQAEADVQEAKENL